MSLLGSSDSFAATSDDHGAANGGRPAVNSRPSTPLQPAEEKPLAAAAKLAAALAPACDMPSWQLVRCCTLPSRT